MYKIAFFAVNQKEKTYLKRRLGKLYKLEFHKENLTE